MKSGILYISYDGMLEPLGQSQVLSYLEKTAATHRIHLISFEKKDDWLDTQKRQAIAARVAAAGIQWQPMRYHRHPTVPATAFDILAGIMVALYLVVRHRLRLVHARSYVAATIALVVKKLTGVRFLFDMRGFWVDERVDGGLWPAGGALYRHGKRQEQRLLTAADRVVTLTQASAEEIRSFPYLRDRCPPITVIPTCADLQRFTRQQAPPGSFTFGFIGAASTWTLLDETLSCFRILREFEPDARLLIVNRNEHAYIRERLNHAGIGREQFELIAADHQRVPALVSRMNIATALRQPAYSQIACAPTKLAEYLGCGVPCLSNEGIGDVAAILNDARVGVALPGFSMEQKRAGVAQLLALAKEPGIRERCVAAARRYFSLDDGAALFGGVYQQLTEGPAQTDRAAA